MRTKLVYRAPVSVSDSLDDPVKDARVLAALDGTSCLQGTVLEYMEERLPEQTEFRGGYLRLVLDGKRLRVCIEIDSPRRLTKAELSALREEIDGQVSDGIGEGGFDFVADEADLAIRTFPEPGGRRGVLAQVTGDAWRPKSRKAEAAANRRRCKAAARAAKDAEQAAEAKRAARKAARPDPKKLLKLIDKGFQAMQPGGIKQEIAAEIARLGGDLGFLPPGRFPFVRLCDVKLLRLLLDAGLNPNLHDRDGHSLLRLAVGDPASLALLLDRGADVNLRDTDVYQGTALMDAAFHSDIASVRLLLARGADPFPKDRFGRTALDQARENSPWEDTPATIKALEAAMKRP